MDTKLNPVSKKTEENQTLWITKFYYKIIVCDFTIMGWIFSHSPAFDMVMSKLLLL